MKPAPWRGDPVRSVFVDPVTGAGVCDNGQPIGVRYSPTGGRMSTANLLLTAEANGARRVFLTGAKPTTSAWLDEPAPDGWAPAGHFYELRDPCGRWRDPAGKVVEVRRVASWFGEGDYPPEVAREAMRLVHLIVMRASRQRVGVMASPAAVGQSLWADSLGAAGRDALEAQLDPDMAELIRSTSPQHREEVVGRCFDDCDEHLPAPKSRAPELHYLDAVFMYAACTRELGVAPVGHLEGERYAGSFWQQYPYARARYRVRFTVPEGWQAAGLLPVKHPNGRNWHYPNRPGVTGETWVDAAELHVAVKNGWRCEPVELIRFTAGRPLDTFTERVLRLREIAEGERSRGPVGAMASAGVRAMFVRTIGSFHSRGRDRSFVVPAGSPLPDDVTDWTTRADGSRLYTKKTTVSGAATAFARPELSSQVWARARARVVEKLLTVDPAAVVAVWGDALYLTEAPGDAGSKPGQFRVKGHLAGPVSRPKTIGELLRLREKMSDA